MCASSSCPPIDIYTAEDLNDELDQAGKSFLNGGGLVVDRAGKSVRMSRIFKWYEKDFGNRESDILTWLADFLYDARTRNFLKAHAYELTTEYQKYDWRLNRMEGEGS